LKSSASGVRKENIQVEKSFFLEGLLYRGKTVSIIELRFNDYLACFVNISPFLVSLKWSQPSAEIPGIAELGRYDHFSRFIYESGLKT
jgi:hypothetical protein